MATQNGNGADGGRSTSSRAHAMLRAITLVAFATGVWCVTGSGVAHGDEGLGGLPAQASSTVVRILPATAGPGEPARLVDRGALLRPVGPRLGRVVGVPQVLPAGPLAGAPRAGGVRASRGAGAARLAVHRVPRTVSWRPISARPRDSADAGTRASLRPVAGPGRGFPRDAGSGPAGQVERPRSVTPSWSADPAFASGSAKSAGLGALQHDFAVPPAPLDPSGAVTGEVPALRLRGTEPPVSPD
jgi:hypothetical protein